MDRNHVETAIRETLLCKPNFLSHLPKGVTKFLSNTHGQQQRDTSTQVLLGAGTDRNWQAAAVGRKRSTQTCPARGRLRVGGSLSAALREATGSLA